MASCREACATAVTGATEGFWLHPHHFSLGLASEGPLGLGTRREALVPLPALRLNLVLSLCAPSPAPPDPPACAPSPCLPPSGDAQSLWQPLPHLLWAKKSTETPGLP